jgi:phage terminase small subunit
MNDRYLIPASDRNRKRGRPKRTMIEREAQKLTKRQELFVKEWVSKDGQITKRDAAIAAGYPVKSAHARANDLTNPKRSPHVVKAIREYKAELDKKYAVDYGRHVKDLQRIRDEALDNGAYSAAVAAEKARGQAEGSIYINKSEIRHGSIDQMDRAQVMKAIEELKASYEPVATLERVDIENETSETKERVELLEAAKTSDSKKSPAVASR